MTATKTIQKPEVKGNFFPGQPRGDYYPSRIYSPDGLPDVKPGTSWSPLTELAERNARKMFPEKTADTPQEGGGYDK